MVSVAVPGSSQVHWAVGRLVTGALLHIAVKAPQDAADRRALLTGLGAAVGAVTVTTVGQSLTRSPHSTYSHPASRTAVAAGLTGFTATGRRLQVRGPRPYALSLDELYALPQHEAELPIACVEGWSQSAHWTGVRVLDLLKPHSHQAPGPSNPLASISGFFCS